jgi:hypothetical protein
MLYLVLRSSDLPSLLHIVPRHSILFSSILYINFFSPTAFLSLHFIVLSSPLPTLFSHPPLLSTSLFHPTLFLFHSLSFTLTSLYPTHPPLHSSSLPTAAQGVQLAMRQLFSDPVNGVYANGRTSYGPAAPGSLGRTLMRYTLVAVETVFRSLESLLMFSLQELDIIYEVS